MSEREIRILNLEDNPVDTDLIVRELKQAKLQATITRVDTEERFRNALATLDPEIILADYRLPGFDGVEALAIARDLAPDTPFIFVSGSIGEDRAVQALRQGATDYVIKDRLSRLPSAITRAFSEKHDRRMRHWAQEALRLSEERFRYAAMATQEVIGDWNLSTDSISFNPALLAVWGHDLPDAEADAEWWSQRIHPQERGTVLMSLHSAIASDAQRWSMEFRFQHATGGWGHVISRALIVRNGDGLAERTILTMLDVTARRLAEERIEASERLFRSVAETASDGIILSDLNGRIVFWNAGAARLFGYTSEEIIGQNVALLIPERHRISQRWARLAASEAGGGQTEGHMLELEGLRRDGNEFSLEMSLTVWSAGEETFCTAVVRDITARIVSERRTRIEFGVAKTLSEEGDVRDVLPRMLECIGVALRWQVGLLWEYDSATDALRASSMWANAETQGSHVFERSRERMLRPGEGLPGAALSLRRAAVFDSAAGQGLRKEPRVESLRADGLEYGVAFPVVEQGAITSVMEIFTSRRSIEDSSFTDLMTEVGKRIGDSFDRRRMERQLEQANRVSSLGRVAATIAHEFNNLLMGIQLFADVIRRDEASERSTQAASHIIGSVARGKRVTQEILRFTQPSPPALQSVPFGEWLLSLLSELRGLAGEGIEIECRIDRAQELLCDPAQIQQVITNLVLNARDSMAGRGRIAIALEDAAADRMFSFGRVPATHALITVTDTGAGMSPDVLKSVFEPLFTTKRTGTGLGLSVAHQVIARHGGSIHVESASGKGTTFFILLPIAAAVSSGAGEEDAVSVHSTNLRRVVIVEDEETVAGGLALMLEMEGIETRVVERGSEAPEAVEMFQPDAVILDVHLSDMSGIKVFRQLAARHPTLPVLFSSGAGDEAAIDAFSGTGRVGFLRKPYDARALMEALREIVAAS